MTPNTAERLLRAIEHLDYSAYDAPRWVNDNDADDWVSIITAIQREAADEVLLRAEQAILLREHDYGWPADVSDPDNWTDSEMGAAAAAVAGVLIDLRGLNSARSAVSASSVERT